VAGRSVPLGQLAHLEPGFSAGSILRFDRQREGSISIEVDGVPIPTATDRIEARVAQEVNLPPGVTLYYYGLRKEANESFLSLARAAVVAIFLIYTILVIRFQSLGQPALVVLAIPMALIGSIWGLVLTGMSIGFTAFLGMIALTGIVVNDAIVLLDYTNTLRDRGRVLRDAIIEGAQTRVRPVLMTSLTTIAGLLPLALQGGDFWGPFGYAMIFGLAASTLLTLLILPASYWLLEGRRHRRFAWALPGRRRLAPAE
jgi:HAE1 family hydrophobic/amphiphilic exporter-1